MISNEISFFQVEDSISGNVVEWVQIDRGNDEFTSMPKSVWDELNANTEGTR